MLLSVGRKRYQADSSRDSIHNYYEQMVLDQLTQTSERANEDADFLADTACVALNRLPPRYVRHDVDMTFFLSPDDLQKMVNSVADATNYAIEYVKSREAEKSNEDE
ncbi:MAG: hypothetical protein COA42_02755 [Alteromonadaceae bacterium]|nr:MAG: hypothetical protein COA42_02755 [Alteromonadaceae bacterium]